MKIFELLPGVHGNGDGYGYGYGYGKGIIVEC